MKDSPSHLPQQTDNCATDYCKRYLMTVQKQSVNDNKLIFNIKNGDKTLYLPTPGGGL